MSRLTKAAILAAATPAIEDVEVPEWGGSVRVRTLTALERESFLMSVIGSDMKVDRGTYRVKLAAKTIVDDEGRQMFTVDEIGAMDFRGLERVFAVADRLNTVDEAKVEEAVKN